jgi:hypothetical protein
MTASVPRRCTNDFSLTSAAGPYMTNSIPPFFATVPCSHKTSEFVPLPLGIYYAWLSLYAGVLSFHVSGKASTHSAAMTQNPCAPTRA